MVGEGRREKRRRRRRLHTCKQKSPKEEGEIAWDHPSTGPRRRDVLSLPSSLMLPTARWTQLLARAEAKNIRSAAREQKWGLFPMMETRHVTSKGRRAPFKDLPSFLRQKSANCSCVSLRRERDESSVVREGRCPQSFPPPYFSPSLRYCLFFLAWSFHFRRKEGTRRRRRQSREREREKLLRWGLWERASPRPEWCPPSTRGVALHA